MRFIPKFISGKFLGVVMTSACACLIAFLSIGFENSSGISFGPDKLLHVIGYACFVLPMAATQPRSLFWFLPTAMFFGVIIELVQPYFGRSSEGLDMIANATGLGLGALIGVSIHKLFRFIAKHQNRRRIPATNKGNPRV